MCVRGGALLFLCDAAGSEGLTGLLSLRTGTSNRCFYFCFCPLCFLEWKSETHSIKKNTQRFIIMNHLNNI